MLRKFGFLLFFAFTLVGSSGLRAEEDMIWAKPFESNALAFHPNNQILAIGEENIGVILVDVLTGEPLDTLINTDKGQIMSITFNNSGNKLAVVTDDLSGVPYLSKISVWDIESKVEKVIQRNQVDSYISKVLYSPNDSLLAFDLGITFDNNDINGIYVINTKDYSLKSKIEVSPLPISFSFSKDSKFLALGRENSKSSLFVYNLIADSMYLTLPSLYTSPIFSPSKDELFVLKWKQLDETHWTYDSFKVLDPNNGFSELRSINLPAQFESYQLSSDGNFMAYSGYNVYLINTNDGKVAYNYNLEGNVAPISISKDMKYIAISTLIMLKARFGNASVKENPNQYFSFVQDANYTNIIITKLNQELNIKSIEVSDITGNVVRFVNDPILLTNEQIAINTDSLSSGTYYMNITTNTGVYSHSFIIMR